MKRHHEHKGDAGQVMVFFAAALLALVGVAAVTIDGSMLYANRRRLQNAADAAALGATRYMAKTWKGGSLAVADSDVYAVALHEAQANGFTDADGTLDLDYLDSTKAVVATHPSAPPGTARGAKATVSFNYHKTFTALIGLSTIAVKASASGQFGPPGSGTGVMPLVVDASLGGDNSGMQPPNGNGNGSYVNAEFIDTSGMGQALSDAVANGMHATMTVGASYPVSTSNDSTIQPSVVSALSGRISQGQQRGDSITSFDSGSPQLMIVGTTRGNFGNGTPLPIESFRAFFLQSVDSQGNWLRGAFVDAPLGFGSIDSTLPYTGVTLTRLIS